MDFSLTSETEHRLALLAVKNGVSLGGLSPEERQLVLAVAIDAVPLGQTLSESQVNACLKAALAGRVCFLGTDHVELRRWLVDAGWMLRDGFGRAYVRADQAQLPEPLRELGSCLSPLDLDDWIAARRQDRQASRDARRAAWEARQGAAA